MTQVKCGKIFEKKNFVAHNSNSASENVQKSKEVKMIFCIDILSEREKERASKHK